MRQMSEKYILELRIQRSIYQLFSGIALVLFGCLPNEMSEAGLYSFYWRPTAEERQRFISSFMARVRNE